MNSKPYIKYWRDKRGLSQEDLAELAHTTRETINRIETGARGGSFAIMTAIAQAQSNSNQI